MLEFKLLGQFDVRVKGQPLVIPSRPAQSLLAYLLLTRTTPHRREKLAGLLWPDSSEVKARHNLSQGLWRLRKSLDAASPPQSDLLLSDDFSVAIDPHATYSLDVALLEGTLSTHPSTDDLMHALDAYRGELLPDFYDEWVNLERERLHALFEAQVGRLLDGLCIEQRWTDTLTWAERWIALGQSPEPAFRALMVAHSALGNRSQVATVFERCVSVLKEDLGVEPSEQTRALYERLAHGQDAQRASALPAPTPTLPTFVVAAEQPSPESVEPPYKGLHFFDETDAPLFFGRERLVATLVSHLSEHHLLTLVGASGSGKSSLVRAGLIPALKACPPPQEGMPAWDIQVLTPTSHPVEALAASLTHNAPSLLATTTLMDDLARDPRALRVCAHRTVSEGKRLLLLIDQFEELFSLCREQAERRAFIDNLLLATAPELERPVYVVVALRADFYAHCAQYPNLREALARRQEYIGPMTTAEMRRAIEGPAQRGGWEFEAGLVDLILREVGNEPGALPLLSHALLETWKRRQGRTLTFEGYAQCGGVRGAIAQTAETVYHELLPERQQIARDIFLQLTELGEGTPDTRRRVRFEELVSTGAETPGVRAVLNTLVEARLVTLGEDTAEVAHEALIREWPALREWLDQNREGLRLHRRLTEAAQAWDKSNRDEGELYRAARLVQALEWAKGRVPELNPLEREFLDASKAWHEREEAEREAQRQRELEAAQRLAEAEQRRAETEIRRAQAERARSEEQARANRRLRQRAMYLASALVVAAVLAFAALVLAQQSDQNAARAENERRISSVRELSVNAVNNLDIDPERSVLLALQAVSVSTAGGQPVMREAEEALHRAVQASRVKLTMRGHSDILYAIASSPDGTRLATGSHDKTIKVWDTATGREFGTLPVGAKVLSVVFSPDGTRLGVDTGGGVAKVLDAVTGRELLSVPVRADEGDRAAAGVAFSPDGKRLLALGDNNTANVWDAATGQNLLTLTGHTAAVKAVTFSRDGRFAATGSEDKTARVWDAVTGKQVLALSGHTVVIYDVSFSPDGKRLATASGDSTAKVWDVDSGRELLTLFGHTSRVQTARFSEDGTRLVTSSLDGMAKVWDAATGQTLLTLAGHTSSLRGALFSSDGRHVFTGSNDQTARVWDVSPAGSREWLTVAGFTNHVLGMALSPDGRRVAMTASHDNTTRVYDSTTGQQLLTLTGHTDEPLAVAFSPDGTRLATGSWDSTIRVWDVATGRRLLSISTPARPYLIMSVVFSPDGKRLAGPTGGNTAKVWDAETGRELLTLTGHSDLVIGTAFSPDGKRLATTSFDRTPKVWDAATGQELLTLVGHKGRTFDLAFSPDGRRLATSSNDGTARVWDVFTGKQLLTLTGHTGLVRGLAFSPDGTHLASASADSTVKVWDVSPAATGKEQPLTLYGHSSATLRVAFSPDGKRLATISEYGMVRIYALPLEDIIAMAKSRLTRGLTTDECRKFLHVEQCP